MSQQHPDLPLAYDWSLGANVKTEMDNNFRVLGSLAQLGVISRTSDEPSSPGEGDRYIHNGGSWSSGSAGDVLAYVDGQWRVYTPVLGWIAFVEDEDVNVIYRGGAWNALNQYGSNSNGTWMQLMNGFLIQIAGSLAVPYNAAGSCLVSWTFPKSFSGSPISVVPDIQDLSTATPGPQDIGLTRATNITTGSADIEVNRVTGTTDFASGDEVGVGVIAIGVGSW